MKFWSRKWSIVEKLCCHAHVKPMQTKSAMKEKLGALESLQKNFGESRTESQQQMELRDQELTQLKVDFEKVRFLKMEYVGEWRESVWWHYYRHGGGGWWCQFWLDFIFHSFGALY